MKKISLNIITGYIVLLIVAATTSIIGVYIAKTISGEELRQYPDYSAIKGKIRGHTFKPVIIAKDHLNKQPATVDFNGIKKRFKVKGRILRAYLYIEAAVDYSKPLTVWDDIYFTINNQGGHLIPDSNNFPTPPSGVSRYLYDLHSISYFPLIKDKENWKNKRTNDNLFELLQDGKNLYIITSISSDRPGRVMKEISIYYECFKGSTCSIEEIK